MFENILYNSVFEMTMARALNKKYEENISEE
jgi:hypothetical protein